jgi:hypothetical protein
VSSWQCPVLPTRKAHYVFTNAEPARLLQVPAVDRVVLSNRLGAYSPLRANPVRPSHFRKIDRGSEPGTPVALSIMNGARPERTNSVTAAMKTGAAQTFLFHEQHAEAGPSGHNCGVLPARPDPITMRRSRQSKSTISRSSSSSWTPSALVQASHLPSGRCVSPTTSLSEILFLRENFA